MSIKNLNIFVVLLISAVFITEGVCQDSSSTNFGKNIYRKSWNLGFKVHTTGIGGEFRQERFVTATQKNFWNIDISNIKHVKEQKSFNQGQDESNIVYGKLNSFYQIRAGIGQQKVMFKKLVIRGVQISSVYNLALTVGWLKPVFVEVQVGDLNENPTPSTEQYDPYSHSYERISGKGPWRSGLGSSTIVPGASAKFALNFEFSPEEDEIKAIEAGIILDGFIDPIPQMAFNRQYNVFFNVYISFLFGRKTYL